MLGVLVHFAHRHLVRAPVAFASLAVDLLRAGPALGRAQHDHRPGGAGGDFAVARRLLDRVDVGDRLFERRRHQRVHRHRVVALDVARRVAVAAHELVELLMRDAGEHGRVGDLVAVEVQDRQHRAVGLGVEELVRVPAGRRRAGLRLAVADDAGDDQVGIVERRAVGVRQRVAEFAALVDRAGRLGSDVARNAAGKRELLEQPLHPRFVLGDVGVDLAVDAFEIDVGDDRRAAVAGSGDEQHLEVERFDQPIEVRVDEVEAGRRAPVAEQPRLDVLLDQRLAQQRVVEEIDLADRQVVGGAPVGVDQLEFALRKRRSHRCSFQVSLSEAARRAAARLPGSCPPRAALRRRRRASSGRARRRHSARF